KTGSIERDHGRVEGERRERERDKNYPRSHSRDRDRQSRDYSRDVSRERDWEHERQDYRNDRDWDRDRTRDRDRDRERDRSYKHEDSYRRSYNRDEREERKRPRTPPMQSPKRPHTPHGERKEPSPPEADSFSEEEVVNTEKQKREKEQREEAPPVQKSPVKEIRETLTPPAEETAQMDVEEFEPILSDEEIVDEEMDYDFGGYTNNDDLIKLFVPGVTNLRKFAQPPSFKVTNDEIGVEENLKTTIGIVDDYFKSSITKYVLEDFRKLNTEIKEEFIHLCEKLINTFGCTEHFCEIIKLYVAVKSVKDRKFNKEDKELIEQINTITQTLLDWLKIALNYDMANIQDQPVYKIRHIKCGVRLAEWCSNSSDFVKLLWESGFNIHEVLLNLYDQEYMALSIKLMIIKALDTYLIHKFAIEKFLLGSNSNNCRENGFHDSLCASKNNGYKILVEKLKKNPSVRLKFALNSTLKKINLYEVFYKIHKILMEMRNCPSEISLEDINVITKSLDQILNASQNGQFVFSQPKRFLPVSAQFEIIRSDSKNVLVEYFRMFDLVQCFFLLLSSPSTLNLPNIKTPIFEILSELLKTPEGLDYLSDNHQTVHALLRCLLRSDEEMQYSIQDYIEIKSHNLGLEAAYKIEALYYIESLGKMGEQFSYDCDALEVVDQLHALFCLTFTHIGRISCAEVLGMKNNIKCLLQFLGDVHVKDKSEAQLNKIKKSPGIAYIIDLIAYTVTAVSNIPFLESYCKQLCQLIDQQDIFEDSVAQKLNEIKSYLSPLEGATLNYDNISHFVEVISKQIENMTSFPGQLITSLRVIQYLGISPYSCNSPVLSENPLCNYIELKYKHVILQLFSLDGTSILTKLLQKICEHFEQPSLHTSVFVSTQGFLIINLINPCIELLKQMLTYVIQCRNTNFKDLTAVPVLLQTYSLLHSFPSTSGTYHQAQQACKNIIDTLLVYTQPVSDEIHEKDSLNKTLWTLMCGEVIKYVTSAPYTFVSGLLVLSELLPLPLPIQTTDDLSKDEVTWAVNLRKLWSAHLHPHSGNIQELINKLCTTSHQQLLNLLRRVCVQLADLAANSAVMIARGILDTVYKALVPNEESKVGVCNNHVTRLLNFLACLVTHGTLKCAVLHLIHSTNMKIDEKYPSLVQVFGQVLKINNNSTGHIQAQECILSIIQSFCDIEITLLQTSIEKSEITSDLYLANALPTKEHLLNFISIILDYLQVENSFVTYLPAVRTLLLLTEHDYGFYHLREQLIKKNDLFGVILNKLAKSFSKDNAECLSTLNTLVEFIRVCTATEEVDASLLYTPRKMKMSLTEIKALVGWKNDSNGSEEKHPLILLEEILKKLKDEEITFESLLEGVSAVIKLLHSDSSDGKEPSTEPILPEPEILLVQFSGRLIFSSSDVCDERLTIRYWLSIPNDESENENVSCDLAEVARQFLPQEFNVAREIEKLCRICPSENSNEKENHDNDQKTKMKKPFITPARARGFPRTIQQRSDLFRSRPPNTSRPPSLHVDDFVALETCGAQPTGPTGYNKFSRELLASTRIARGSRGRAFVTSERSVQCRQ
ncbi:virilizer, partial [Asbolus verrucosus]